MLLPQIILLMILLLFVVFASRYFVLNSIRTKAQRTQTMRSVILLLYYLPVFIQGLLLFYSAVIYFYFIAADIFLLLQSVCYPKALTALPGPGSFVHLLFICLGCLPMAFNAWLAKISANAKTGLQDLLAKCCYCGFSFFAVKLLLLSAPLLKFTGFIHSPVQVNSNTLFVLPAIIAWVILLAAPLYTISRHPLLQYLRLSVKVGLLYTVVCMLPALLVFICYSVLKLVF